MQFLIDKHTLDLLRKTQVMGGFVGVVQIQLE